MTDSDLRSEIISVSRALLEKGMNIATTGNVSARLAKKFLLTPTGIVPDHLTPESIVPTGFDGTFVGDYAPSSEWALHAKIYQNFPDAGAVVHCHSDYCVALACLREPLPAFHYMIAAFGAGWYDSITGAANAMAGGTTIIQPDADRHRTYQQLLGIYRKLYNSTSALNHDMVAFAAAQRL